MTRDKFLLLFILFTSGYTQAQWEVQYDTQNFIWLDRVFIVDEDNGWATGSLRTLGLPESCYYTVNGGDNWYYLPGNEGYDVHFVNKDTGFISAPNGIIRKTVNGGSTWTDIQTSATVDVLYLFFTDENNGWANLWNQNDNYQLLHTMDCGNTWETQQVFETDTSTVTHIFFTNDSIGWVSGNYRENSVYYPCILKTTDRGDTWTIKYNFESQFYGVYDIFFTDTLTGWVAGYKSTTNDYILLHTEDGGDTWEEQTLPELINWYGSTREIRYIYSIEFANDTLGWLACDDEYNSGYILLTTDAGETWQQQYVNENFSMPIFDLCSSDEKNAWAVGYNYIYHNNNADTIITVDVEEVIEENIFLKVIPNPTAGIFTIDSNLQYLISNILITDITGKEILNNDFLTHNTEINILNYPNGIYLITIQYKIENQLKSITKKLIKL